MSSILKTMMSNEAVPIAAALRPYKKNIEKTKLKQAITIPVKYILLFVRPTIINISVIKTVVINMAFLRCTIGPGESTTLAHRAPSDKVMPY